MAYIHLAKEKKYYKGEKVMPKHGNTHTHTHANAQTHTHINMIILLIHVRIGNSK